MLLWKDVHCSIVINFIAIHFCSTDCLYTGLKIKTTTS